MSTRSFVIQLADGSLSPTQGDVTSANARLYTTVAGQRRLELMIWEDTPGQVPPQAFVGVAVTTLPLQTPAYTAFDVTLRVANDGTVGVNVTLSGHASHASLFRLRRRAWATDRLNHLMQASGKLNDLLSYWGAELTDAERREVEELISKLDDALAGGSIDDVGMDRLNYEGETMARQIELIRARDTLICALLAYGGAYLTLAQQQQLFQLQATLTSARQRGDRPSALALIEANDHAFDALGAPLIVLVHAMTALQSRRLPAQVASTVQAAVREVEQGLSQNNDQQVSHGLSQLMYTLDGTMQALQQQHQAVRVSTRPIDVIP